MTPDLPPPPEPPADPLAGLVALLSLALHLAAAVLASWQAVELWRHGSVFAEWRDRAACWAGLRVPPRRHRPWARLGELLGCPLCLSPWASLACVLMALSPVPPLRWLVYALAVSRLANVANDLLHPFSRTPKDQVPEPPEPPEPPAEGGGPDSPLTEMET